MEQVHNKNLNQLNKTRNIEFENLLFCFAIAFQAITAIFCGIIRQFVSPRGLDTLFLYCLLAIVLLKSFSYFRFKISKQELAVMGIILATWIYSFITCAGNESVLIEVLKTILKTCSFIWLASRVVHITDKMIIYLRLCSYIMIVRFPVDLFLSSGGDLQNAYSQYAGYQLFIGFTMLLIPMLLQRRLYDYIAAVFCAAFALTTGARGPFAFIVIAFVVCLLIVSSQKQKLIKIIPLITIATIILLTNIQKIMILFMNLVSIEGGNARTIMTILNGNFFSYLSGRERIYPIALDYIAKHPLFGTGFVNDRIYISRVLGNVAVATGSYAHNFFLEIGMQFGLIAGVVIVMALLTFLINTYRKQNSLRRKLFYAALCCSAFLPLIVSGSYLTSPMFYALLGYSFTNSFRQRQDNTEIAE